MDTQLIEWEPRFSVGNDVLDGQHRMLLILCNKAVTFDPNGSKKGTSQFHEILNELARYVNIHFRTEEAVLEAHEYPAISQHLAEHDLYSEKLTEILMSATVGIINSESLRHYISSLWSDHILGSDKEYASFITG